MIVSPPRPKRRQNCEKDANSSSRPPQTNACRNDPKTHPHISFKQDDMSDMSSSFGGDCNASAIFRPKLAEDEDDESALLHLAVEKILDEALMGEDCPDAVYDTILDEEIIQRVPNFQTGLSSSKSTIGQGDGSCASTGPEGGGTKFTKKSDKISRKGNLIPSSKEKLLHNLRSFYTKKKNCTKRPQPEKRYLMEGNHGPLSDDVNDTEENDPMIIPPRNNSRCRHKFLWSLFLILVMSCIIGGIAGVITIMWQENAQANVTSVVDGNPKTEDVITYEEKINPEQPTAPPKGILLQPTQAPSYFHPSTNQKNSETPSIAASEEPSFVRRTPSYIPSSTSPFNTPFNTRQPMEALSTSPSTTAAAISIMPTAANTNAPTSLPTSIPSESFNLMLNETIQALSPDTDLLHPDSPQSKAWSSLDSNELRDLDKFALLTLYYAINVSIWDEQIALLDSSSGCCSWTGVLCSEEGRVTKLDLSFQKNLFGTLPSELALATNLEVVSISGTSSSTATKSRIGGSIPNLWGDILSNLRILHLYDNQLVGSIPDWLWHHAKLQELRLDGNQLTGTIFATPSLIEPRTSTTKFQTVGIKTMDLSNNRLLGSISNSKEHWSAYANLERLSLKGNMLDGTIPSGLSHFLPNLIELHIQQNNFRGTLPDGLLSDDSNLVWLAAHDNHLTGTIPSVTYKEEDTHQIFSRIEGLELQNNQFRGSLPQDYASSFPSLRVLDVSNNFLTGSVPLGYNELTNLLSLSLRHNKLLLRGDVSSALCNTLGYIQVDCNRDYFLIVEEGCPCCHRCYI
mmetsp:Transcript_6359/g.9359  ORF Transcript_6359/g.9359 Transcript_6359/m.9359 type:complete len:797 (-) Transcript_6359:122-2512(-)